MTIVLGGAFLLWASHRVYLTYTHVVAREERHRVRQSLGLRQPHAHIGPTCFLTLDLIVIFVVIRVLESLAFDTSQMSELRCLFLALTHFSGVVAIWMLLEGQHFALFYGKIAQALGNRGFDSPQSAFTLPDIGQRSLRLAFFAMVGAPLLLELGGVKMGEASKESLLLLFTTCFLMPQICLLAFLVHKLEPIRRHAGVR